MRHWIIIFFILFIACTTDNPQYSVQNVADKDIDNLNITDDFNFVTSREIELSIQDDDNAAVYTVYRYSDQVVSFEYLSHVGDDGVTYVDTLYTVADAAELLAKGKVDNNQLLFRLQVPAYHQKLYVVRRLGTRFSSTTLEINSDVLSLNANSLQKKAAEGDALLAVNANGELFSIDPNAANFPTNPIADIPAGASAVATDVAGQNIYFLCLEKNKVDFYRYDQSNNQIEQISTLKLNCYRLAFNPHDGFLYTGYKTVVIVLDPSTGEVVTDKKIKNIKKSDGGDYVFDADGNLHLACESGFYALDPGSKGKYNARELSKELRDFDGATGAAVDSDGLVWISGNPDNGVTGMWLWDPDHETMVYAGSVAAEISDMALSIAGDGNASATNDRDADGVDDLLDEFPDDAQAAFSEFSPTRNGWISFAFEDLWPTVGDYDFNDLVVYARFEKVLNAENNIVRMNADFSLKNIGGSFVNGFGFILDGTASSSIASVDGYMLTENIVTLAANGTEADENNATIIVFDNSQNVVNQNLNLTVQFNSPIAASEFAFADINPFIFINGDRERELHLPERQVTSKAQRKKAFDYVYTNNDEDGNFKSENNLPWAIAIIYEFKFPKPGKSINRAYKHFNEWAESSGSLFDDWYLDKTGYQDKNNIEETEE